MNKKHSEEVIQAIINQYNNGKPVAHLCSEHGIPRSTIYYWIQQHRKLKSTADTEISYQDYHNLKRKHDKLENMLNIMRVSECSISDPLQTKLSALEKLYESGQYSVHSLCDALSVSRGTFYNHVFRRQKNKWFDIRREDLREQVRIVFDESEQRFGSRKICAVLVERGFRVSAGYVADLMREMSLQSIVTYSKREYKKQAGLTKKQNKHSNSLM
jgi:transposase-like protein